MMKKMNKKAFTLIELIVVIAIIGILVLLGIPRFIEQKDKVELTRIQHDVRVVEQEIGTEFINHYDDFNNWENNNKDFNQLAQEGKLFKKEGVVEKTEVFSIDETYKVIPEIYKSKINTKLKGTFYANSGGKVYYEHTKPLGGMPTEPKEELGYSDEKIEDLIKEGYIPIATAEDLDSIRNNTERIYGEGTKWKGLYTGGLDKEYIQVKDIDLSGYSEKEEGWVPIGTEEGLSPFYIGPSSISFTGTYDGGNYVITGLEVKGEDKDNQGLFGYTGGATISNVGLIDNKVTGRSYVGSLVGSARYSKISNSYATGSVEGSGSLIGGLVGSASYSKISNSYSTGSVTGDWGIGGLVGEALSSTMISNSYATGEVTGTGEYSVGGLVGQASYSSTISNSYATGNVTGTSTVGGLVGWADGEVEISNSYAEGSVTGDWAIGGLVGYALSSTMISNSYATGEVTGTDSIGGLVGEASNDTKINNSYATGEVTGDTNVGGLVGEADESMISNSYWDTETTKQEESSGQDASFGKTTPEMKKQIAYSGWDFDTVWKIDEGNDYPKLR